MLVDTNSCTLTPASACYLPKRANAISALQVVAFGWALVDVGKLSPNVMSYAKFVAITPKNSLRYQHVHLLAFHRVYTYLYITLP